MSRLNLRLANPQLMESELPWDVWASSWAFFLWVYKAWPFYIMSNENWFFFWGLISLILLARWIKGMCPNRLFIKIIVMPHPPSPRHLHWPFKGLHGLLSVEFQTSQEYYQFILFTYYSWKFETLLALLTSKARTILCFYSL
jgi:hypothetical protein